MARRRYRKVRSGRRRKGFRRRSGVRKALSRVRSLSRKMAGEVKKIDVNAIIPEEKFTPLSPAIGPSSDIATSLPDFGYLYNIFQDADDNTPDSVQGINIGDFVGNQIRAKYLYVGIHVQMPNRPTLVAYPSNDLSNPTVSAT